MLNIFLRKPGLYQYRIEQNARKNDRGGSMSLDFNKIKAAAEGYKADMTAFLREIIRLPSESSHEGEKAKRIQKKMDELGFNKTWIDPLGN